MYPHMCWYIPSKQLAARRGWGRQASCVCWDTFAEPDMIIIIKRVTLLVIVTVVIAMAPSGHAQAKIKGVRNTQSRIIYTARVKEPNSR